MLYERSGDCDGQVIYSCKGRRDLMRAVPARAKSSSSQVGFIAKLLIILRPHRAPAAG